MIARKLIKVNIFHGHLIMDREVVKELIQDQLTVSNLKRELELLLLIRRKKRACRGLDCIKKNLLSEGGNASAKAAKILLSY